MRRAVLLTLMAGAATLAVGTTGTALAGGGCHGEATQRDETGQDAATVAMVDACFRASITNVDPGTSVTFANEDVGITHNVGGTMWGSFEDMYPGDTYTAIFDTPGIFPFACGYHAGMTGAIVVGGGTGAGNGMGVSTAPPKLDPVSTAAATSTTPSASGASATPWIVAAGLGGIGVGASAVFAIRRRRSTTD